MAALTSVGGGAGRAGERGWPGVGRIVPVLVLLPLLLAPALPSIVVMSSYMDLVRSSKS